jgi:hypothetical protein
VTNFDDVGTYEVNLKVSLEDYPKVFVILPFKVKVLYPSGDLQAKDGYPNGFFVENLISVVYAFVNGPV